MTIASKLTESVRQAKASAAKQHDETGPDAPEPQARQEDKAVANTAPETKRPSPSKNRESEPPVEPLPNRRVWPD